MPEYKYICVDNKTKKIKGVAKAETPSALISYLESKEMYLLDYCVNDEVKNKYKLKDSQLGEFSSQISIMLTSGMTVRQALSVLIKKETNQKVREIYININKEVTDGVMLSDSLSHQGVAFPEMFINMYKCGEENGQLGDVAKKVSTLYINQNKLNNKIKGAMLYPKILGVVTVIVSIILFTFIMPNLFDLFSTIKLPLPTRILVALSNLFIKKWYLVIIVIACFILGIKLLFKNKKVRFNFDKMKVRMPKIGKLLKIIYTSRFARTLSSLISSGLSVDKAFSVCSGTLGNVYIASQFADVVVNIRNGQNLSASVEKIDGFDIRLPIALYVGQESGQLNKTLEDIADSFDVEAQTATQKLLGILEPCIIVVMAVVIGFIALSIMLPIMKIYNNVG